MTRLLAAAACVFGVVVVLSSATPATGAFPGSNGRIAFVSDRHGNDEIHTAAADGSDIQRLNESYLPSRRTVRGSPSRATRTSGS
jgi:hypothetical protein